MNVEVEDPNGIFHVKDDGHRVDWLQRHHIILRKFIMSYLCRHCKVALEDLFSWVNIIGL